MKNNKSWGSLLLLIFVLFAAVFIIRKLDAGSEKPKLSSVERSWITSQKGTKIPFLIPENDSPYFYETPEGEFRGVYYDYLKNLEKDYGLQFQVIKKDTDQFTQQINSGKEVLVFNATANYDREKNYAFLDLSSQTSIVLVKKMGRELPKDSKYLKKLGIIRNTIEARDYFMHFSPYKYRKMLLSDLDEGVEKLKKGEIDLLLGKSKDFMVMDTEISVVEKLRDLNNSLAINRKYPELYSLLGKTLQYFDQKHFTQSFIQHRNLFIAQKLKDTAILKEVKNRYSKIVIELPDANDFLPLYYFDGEKFKGYIPTMLKNMSTITGIPVELVKSSSSEKKHIRAMDFKSGRSLNIPYYQIELVVVGRDGSRYTKNFTDLKGKSVGIVLNDFTKHFSLKENIDFVPFPSTEDALNALNNSEVDYVIGDFIFLDSKIENMHLGNKLKILGVIGESNHFLSFSFQEEDKALYTLFSQMMPKDISEFSTLKNILVSPKIIRMDYYFFGAVFLILLGILSGVLLFLKNNIRHKNRAESLNRAMISSFEMAASFNDEDTGEHIVRVTKYSELLAKEIGLPSQTIRDIERYASLHDVGKIGIPDAILRKPGKLTPEEISEMRKHSDIGYRLVKNAGLGRVAENLVRFHHERWDGKGYPLGLQKKSIPIEARVVAVADVYDALRQKRSYKSAYTHHEAVQIIVSESGIFFDPELIEVFLKVNNKFNEIFNKH